MLSKTLIQFSIDGQGCVPSLLFDLRSNSGRGNEENGISFKRSCTCAASLSAPNPAADRTNPCLHGRRLDTHRQVWVRGRQLTKGSDKGRVKKSPDKVTICQGAYEHIPHYILMKSKSETSYFRGSWLLRSGTKK